MHIKSLYPLRKKKKNKDSTSHYFHMIIMLKLWIVLRTWGPPQKGYTPTFMTDLTRTESCILWIAARLYMARLNPNDLIGQEIWSWTQLNPIRSSNGLGLGPIFRPDQKTKLDRGHSWTGLTRPIYIPNINLSIFIFKIHLCNFYGLLNTQKYEYTN